MSCSEALPRRLLMIWLGPANYPACCGCSPHIGFPVEEAAEVAEGYYMIVGNHGWRPCDILHGESTHVAGRMHPWKLGLWEVGDTVQTSRPEPFSPEALFDSSQGEEGRVVSSHEVTFRPFCRAPRLPLSALCCFQRRGWLAERRCRPPWTFRVAHVATGSRRALVRRRKPTSLPQHTLSGRRATTYSTAYHLHSLRRAW